MAESGKQKSRERRGARSLRRGALLVAPPIMQDVNFRRSVVLLCEHSDSGSFGLILNQHVEVETIEALEDIVDFRHAIHVGGPVQMDTLHFLHGLGEELAGSVEVCNGVYWGGDFEELQKIVKTKPVSAANIRFYLGYSGWTEGQLEEEVEAGGWIVDSAEESVVFRHDTDSLWRDTMIALGGEFALLANFPDEPRLN